MRRPLKAFAGGLAAAVLISTAAKAAPLVLGDDDMSQVQTTYRLAHPDHSGYIARNTAAARPIVAPFTPGLGVFSSSMSAALRPAARPGGTAQAPMQARMGDAAVLALRPVPVPRPALHALEPSGAPNRILSDAEADQVTAAGFLFPVAVAISARAVRAQTSMVFIPAARMKAIMRNVVVVPRPSSSMIVDINRL